MSEYQYYEFQALDRPLTRTEMADLRALSTRATITPTRFQNVYHWASFKGDPLALMERYFDAFVYVANWGTRQFMLRLPHRLVDSRAVQSYAAAGSLRLHARTDAMILEFTSEDEEGAGWVEDEEAASWMPALLPVRAELASGDARSLYLAWLSGAQAGMLDGEELEPPVPPRLGHISASLKALADFLCIDEDLLSAAAVSSPALTPPSPGELERSIAEIPTSEKDALLIRLAKGDEAHVRAELLRRFHDADAPRLGTRARRRTVAVLLAQGEERAAARRRREAERQAADQARREREQALARAKYLESLVGREEELWLRVEALVEMKRPKEYDRAVHILKDLRDLSDRQHLADGFAARLGRLRERCAKRPSLLARLGREGLGA